MYELKHGKMDRDENAKQTGRQAGAAVSVVIMLLAYAVALIGKIL